MDLEAAVAAKLAHEEPPAYPMSRRVCQLIARCMMGGMSPSSMRPRSSRAPRERHNCGCAPSGVGRSRGLRPVVWRAAEAGITHCLADCSPKLSLLRWAWKTHCLSECSPLLSILRLGGRRAGGGPPTAARCGHGRRAGGRRVGARWRRPCGEAGGVLPPIHSGDLSVGRRLVAAFANLRVGRRLVCVDSVRSRPGGRAAAQGLADGGSGRLVGGRAAGGDRHIGGRWCCWQQAQGGWQVAHAAHACGAGHASRPVRARRVGDESAVGGTRSVRRAAEWGRELCWEVPTGGRRLGSLCPPRPAPRAGRPYSRALGRRPVPPHLLPRTPQRSSAAFRGRCRRSSPWVFWGDTAPSGGDGAVVCDACLSHMAHGRSSGDGLKQSRHVTSSSPFRPRRVAVTMFA